VLEDTVMTEALAAQTAAYSVVDDRFAICLCDLVMAIVEIPGQMLLEFEPRISLRWHLRRLRSRIELAKQTKYTTRRHGIGEQRELLNERNPRFDRAAAIAIIVGRQDGIIVRQVRLFAVFNGCILIVLQHDFRVQRIVIVIMLEGLHVLVINGDGADQRTWDGRS
jgi:hypothetical protein